jgi:hypothetical protein
MNEKEHKLYFLTLCGFKYIGYFQEAHSASQDAAYLYIACPAWERPWDLTQPPKNKEGSNNY